MNLFLTIIRTIAHSYISAADVNNKLVDVQRSGTRTLTSHSMYYTTVYLLQGNEFVCQEELHNVYDIYPAYTNKCMYY